MNKAQRSRNLRYRRPALAEALIAAVFDDLDDVLNDAA